MSETAISNLKQSLSLAEDLMQLAEQGVADCQDDGCLVVFGIMRDCAYRIRVSAEKEIEEHLRKGVASGTGS